MQLTYQPFELLLKHPFTIAKFSRTSTPLMLVQIAHEGYTGYGEASMVPYMGESHQSASDFLSKVDAASLNTHLILQLLSITWIALLPVTRP
jgi:L-alanine-DL-glutamate epimerase-like enolase superfamily enzyme